ncbi:major facilitator superfamily domain-containing protein [Apiospora aurea]|uniref:Major facilitator superfamily domain-containing protein n=1 Tax=Apiospora aurea TaxID=335848 RepID=A0ABR1Q9F8_9PEZI
MADEKEMEKNNGCDAVSEREGEEVDAAGEHGEEEGPMDRVAEKKLVRKCDLHVLPPITVLFFLAFMDRTNIGNARIQGMSKDLSMTGRDYNVALFIFFIPYILFEVPSNLIIKRVAPSTWLSLIMVLWGIATIGQGLVTNVPGLVGCRFVLGIFEAGVFPGSTYLISMYYKRYELQWRMSIFFCASVMAGAFSGLLAFAIANMSGIAGLGSWQWIFIIEGLLTVLIGLAAKFWVAEWPEKAAFLTGPERRMLVRRLSADTGAARMDRLGRRAARRIATDWKMYAGTLAYFGVVNTGYAGSFFIPTILSQMGLTSEAAQVRTIPIYVASTLTCLLVSLLTDRLKHRYTFAMVGIAVATTGYILLLCQSHVPVGARYFALFLVVCGGYTTQPVTLAWLANDESGHYKRAVTSAVQVGFGNVGGIVASNVFFDAELPNYWTGFGVSLAMLWVCAGACTWLYLGAKRENRRRDRGERDWRLNEPDADNLGDDHPSWRLAT